MKYKRLSILTLILFVGLAYWWFENASETTTYMREDPLVQPEEVIAPTDGSQVIKTDPVFFDITPADCQNECVNLQEKSDIYAYCRNVCGLSLEPSPINESKTTFPPSLKESYIIKEKAIQEKDLGLCASIPDAHLRKSCEVRVTEDLLE